LNHIELGGLTNLRNEWCYILHAERLRPKSTRIAVCSHY